LSFFTALRFLTVVPLPFLGRDKPEDMGRSTAWFPAVGLVIGLVLAGLSLLFGLFFPRTVADILLIIVMVTVSGAMHLDGFADTCDGIAGHKPVEERWKVMHDSRVGAFGVTGIVLMLLVKFLSLNSIPGNFVIAALLLAPVVSRWAMVYAIVAYRYARPEGLGRAFHGGAGWPRFAVATVITLVLAVFFTWLAGMRYYYLAGPVIVLAAWLITAGMAEYFRRKFAGLTGDTYGAVNEVIEAAVFILISIFASNAWFV
jgi:adenosylcobinamide-GDP ribazoletransferase